MNPRVGGGNEAFEERMRLMGLAVEFGMELARDKERVFWQFDDFDQFAIGSVAAEGETGFFELFPISIVEFVTVAVAFVHNESAIETSGFSADDKLAGLCAETHGAAFFRDAGLLVEHCDNRMGRVGIEF